MHLPTGDRGLGTARRDSVSGAAMIWQPGQEAPPVDVPPGRTFFRTGLEADQSGFAKVIPAAAEQGAAHHLVSWSAARPVPVGRDQPVRAGQRPDRPPQNLNRSDPGHYKISDFCASGGSRCLHRDGTARSTLPDVQNLFVIGVSPPGVAGPGRIAPPPSASRSAGDISLEDDLSGHESIA